MQYDHLKEDNSGEQFGYFSAISHYTISSYHFMCLSILKVFGNETKLIFFYRNIGDTGQGLLKAFLPFLESKAILNYF